MHFEFLIKKHIHQLRCLFLPCSLEISLKAGKENFNEKFYDDLLIQQEQAFCNPFTVLMHFYSLHWQPFHCNWWCNFLIADESTEK